MENQAELKDGKSRSKHQQADCTIYWGPKSKNTKGLQSCQKLFSWIGKSLTKQEEADSYLDYLSYMFNNKTL